VGGDPATSLAFTVTAITIAPAVSGDENQTVCMSTPLTPIVFTTSGATGATLVGMPTLPSGVTGSFTPPNTFTISGTPASAGTFNYGVNLTDGTTSGTGITGTITVTALPAQPSTITATPASVCSGGSVTYSVTNVPGVTYTWSLPGDWVQTGGGTTNSITATAGTAGGTVSVTPSVAGCNGTARTLAVTIATFTQLNPTAPVSNCTGSFGITLAAATATGLGTVTYQWQKSPTGSDPWTNITGATAASLTAAQNTGIITDMYYRRIATTASCGSITSGALEVTYSRADLPEFYPHNLGANPAYSTPKSQMAYLATQTNQLDGNVFGGWYQWGRQNLPYAINPANYMRYSGNGVANRSVLLAAGATYDANGQILTNPGTGGNLTNRADTVHVYGNAAPYDWRGAGASTAPPCTDGNQCNSLWGNGAAINTATSGGGILHTDGNYYQEQVKTVNDPCPSGYRLPTQDDWELMGQYNCNPTSAAGSFSITSTYNTSGGLTWVSVTCGSGDCVVGNSWGSSGSAPWGGYAIYHTADWNVAPVAVGGSLLGGSTPEPILFLPAAGNRTNNSGGVSNVGTSGLYWSSSINGTNAYHLGFLSTSVNPNSSSTRTHGFSVRCVREL